MSERTYFDRECLALAEHLWLVYSVEHRLYWCAERRGYTLDVEKAGRYSLNEAHACCGLRSGRDGRPAEVVVPSPELIALMLHPPEKGGDANVSARADQAAAGAGSSPGSPPPDPADFVEAFTECWSALADQASALANTPGAVYHPDPEINDQVAADAAVAEYLDLRAGYPPRVWTCPECGATHQRGHVGAIGTHRCLSCGYMGSGGVMETPEDHLDLARSKVYPGGSAKAALPSESEGWAP